MLQGQGVLLVQEVHQVEEEHQHHQKQEQQEQEVQEVQVVLSSQEAFRHVNLALPFENVEVVNCHNKAYLLNLLILSILQVMVEEIPNNNNNNRKK